MEEREIDLLDYLRVLLKWRKLILSIFIATCVGVGAISFLLPKWYTAKATVLPPQEQVGGLGSMLAKVPVGGLGISGVPTPASIYVAILKSRTVCEGVIRRLNLIPVYKAKNLEEAVLTLSRRTKIRVSKEGVVQVEVTDGSPRRAADIANAYV